MRIAVVALVAHDRVLLVHRHPSRQNFSDLWDLPGGHVEDGEDWSDAAARECLEELGVGVKNLLQVPVGLAIPGVDARAFVTSCWSGSPANLEPDEHDDLGWFTAEELVGLTMVHPSTRAAVEGALELGISC